MPRLRFRDNRREFFYTHLNIGKELSNIVPLLGKRLPFKEVKRYRIPLIELQQQLEHSLPSEKRPSTRVIKDVLKNSPIQNRPILTENIL